MTSPFVNASEVAGGSFFKPADFTSALALMVEPSKIDKDQPNEYKGVKSVRDIATATVTVFKTSESLETGVPSEVLKDVKLGQPGLTGPCERALGKVLLGTVGKRATNQGNQAWAFRDLDTKTQGQVAAYYEKREAAKAEALAAVPSFD